MANAVKNFEEDSPGDRRGRLTMRLQEKEGGGLLRSEKKDTREFT